MIPAVEIFANMLFSGLAIHFMDSFLRRGGRAAAYKMVLGWAVYFVTVTFLTYPKGYEGLGAISYGIVLFVYSCFSLKGTFGEKIIASVIWNIIVLVSATAALLVTNLSFDRNLTDLWDVNVIIRLGELSSVFFLRIILIKIVILIRSRGESQSHISIKYGILICLFYFCMWANVIGIMMSEMNPNWENRNILILFLLMELTVCVMILFYIYERWSRQEQEKIRHSYLERMNEEQQKYIFELLKSNETARIVKHDLKRYFYVLNTLLCNGEYEECKKYLEELRDMNDVMVNRTAEGDSIHIIMESRKALCEQENISFQYSILGNWEKIDDMDLSVLLLNMLDNAVEAERRETEKDIKAEICNYKGYLMVTCKNRISKSILKKNPTLNTSKKDKEHHGIGLLSMKRIAEKYGGYQIVEEEEGYFVNTVYLRNV